MYRSSDLFLTALAPAIWGSTYFVTTEYLPGGYPITVAMLRALPAGLLLLLFVRRLPGWDWLGKILVLGALNFSIFWALLFVSAYRLPGGVAATVGAVQPLIVVMLGYVILRSSFNSLSLLAAIGGLGGVGLLVLTPEAQLDPIGIIAGFGGALSMGAGTVLSRKWRPPVSLLTFTAWQLTAGGLLLLPFSLWLEPALPPLTMPNLMGLVYLGLIGAALTYGLWFRGISRMEPSAVSTLGFLSPATALLLGWVMLGEDLGIIQIIGVLTVLLSVWIGQLAVHRRRLAPATC